MLVSFSAANFLSFKESFHFTTRASRERQHSHRVFAAGDLKLVPISAIFGANASGKSNFYRAIQFLRKLVLHLPQSADELIAADAFKLDDGISETLPTRFVIELLPNATVYRLTVAITQGSVVEEQLEEVRGEQSVVLYSRIRIGDTNKWDVTELQRRAQNATDREFVGFKTRDTLRNQLFLGVLRGKGIALVDDVTSWFSEQLALMLPEATFRRLEFTLPTTRGLLDFCNETLRTAGTGVHDIYPQKVSWQDFPVPSELKDEIKRTVGERQSTFVIAPDGRRFSVTRHHGELHVARIYTHHRSANGNLVRFELSSESEGTQRFIDLLPAFFEMVRPGRPKVFIIDELDRSLHTQLARHLVKSYLMAMEPTARSQLIFTTHDVTLLDQDLLRRDEIWFMEKDPWGASTIQALSSFDGIRYDRDIRRTYLDGSFGGVPVFSGTAFRQVPKIRSSTSEVGQAAGKTVSNLLPSDFVVFDSAFPATPADEMLCRLTLEFVELRGTIANQDLLDALILATHPDICRSLAARKPTRKTDALFEHIRRELEFIEEHGLRWHQCLNYLQHKGALLIEPGDSGQKVSAGVNFQATRQSFGHEYEPIALYVLSVLESFRENGRSRGPTNERAHAARSFEQLRSLHLAT